MVDNAHDSLVFDCQKHLAEEACWKVKEIMEKPASKLVHKVLAPKGLVCEVEVSWGANWAELVEVKL